MDVYAIMSIFIIVGLMIWHAVIGVVIFIYVPGATIRTTGPIVMLDRYVCCGFLGVYVIIHIVLLTWLYYVPLKKRRDLKQKDIHFRKLTTKKRDVPKQNPKKNSDCVPVLVES